MAIANISGNILTDSGVNVSSLTPTSTTISTTAPLQGGGDLSANRTLSITQSGTSANGYLSSTDWNTFNGKQAALTNPVTGTGTTNYLPKFTGASTIGNSNLITDSGNLGLGVTPSAWASGFTALQVKNASFWSTGNDASITANAYYDGSNYRYIATAGASRTYHNTDGSINWAQAPSGTAGNAITFTQAMTLTASGRLLIGTTTESTYLLDVNGTGRFSDMLYVSMANAANRFQITSTTGTNAAYQKFSNSGGNYYIGADNSAGTALFTSGGVSYCFAIVTESTQSIVLGTNNIARLTIAHTTGAATFSSSVTATSFNSNNFAALDGSYATYFTYGEGGIIWRTGTTERMRLSTGNLLIGTATDSGQKLQVNGITQTNAIALAKTSFSSSTTMTDAFFSWSFGGAIGQTLTLYSSSGHNNMHFIKNESAVPLTISGTIMTLTSGAPASSIVLAGYKTMQIISFGSSAWYIMYQNV